MKAVILAGGTGTRLWPLSHDLKPKQFHAFVGKKTMLQQTYERLSFLKPEDIFVATNHQYEKLVKDQLPKLPRKHLIIEPAMRDTGPCICYAAHVLQEHGMGNETMLIIYADHLIQKSEEFKRILQDAAEQVAKEDVLGVVAVRAKYPNPNLGYIRIGRAAEQMKNDFEVYELDAFVEKPDLETAKKFLYSYKYLWNTGLYLWKVDTILQTFAEHAPEIYRAIVEKNQYESAPKISIDYAIMEKVEPKRVRVFPAELGWNDIGNWAALHEELAKSEKDNVSSENHIGIETEGSIILSNSGKLIATVGLKDMVVVDTPDALLICPKDRALEVKRIVENLRGKRSS